MDDRELVQQILNGDREAGLWLVERYYACLYRFLRARTGCEEAARDLTQQTFCNAWRGLAGFQGTASLKSWLYKIAQNEFYRWVRRPHETVGLENATRELDGQTAQAMRQAMGAMTDAAMVWEALAQLSDAHRETFLLRYVHELSVAEVASILDVPPGTVQSRCAHARERLLELLARWNREPALSVDVAAVPGKLP